MAESSSGVTLAAEARYLHACLFRRPADELTVARYEAAHRRWFAGEETSPLVRRILDRRLDAEAIEFALRRRGRGQELTRKLLIVCYLAEARAEYMGEFVQLQHSPARAWAGLAGATLDAAWKLVMGEYALVRHGLR